MKTRVVILVSMVLALFLLGWLQTIPVFASAVVDGAWAEFAAKQTATAPRQPLPPAVETGANAPLVCGAVLLLIIIVGGVVWNVRQRKTNPKDH